MKSLIVILLMVFSAQVLGDDCRKVRETSKPTPRYAAMSGIQMDLNVNSLQLGAAMSQGAQALGAGKRLCFSADKCGFFGLNVGIDNGGESFSASTTWVIK